MIMIWAAHCTTFFCFFRAGELTEQSTGSCCGMVVTDVSVDSQESPSTVKIHLRRSKTDQFGKGIDIHVYLGTTGDDLCPVSALLAYLAVRGSAAGPLFRLHDSRSLTRDFYKEGACGTVDLGRVVCRSELQDRSSDNGS